MKREDMLKYFEDYNTADYEKTISTYYTGDAVFEAADYKYEGKQNIINFLKESHQGITEKMKPVHLLVERETVAAEIEVLIEVFEDKPEFHIKPLKKGDSLTLRIAAFYDIRDNRICHTRLYRFTKWA
jgi:hypothetical protein